MSQPAGSKFIVIYSLVLAHRAEQQGKYSFFDSTDVRRRPLQSPYSSGKAARAARTRIFFQKEHLGLSWARFGPSWARLRPSWGCFEVLGGSSWTVLGRLGAILGPS